jgi:predicted NBD/HSP70 family sugar kinase
MSGRGRDRVSAVREVGRARVVDVLRAEGVASRAELARATGLSRASVSAAVTALQGEGLVVEEPPTTDRRGLGRGRPPNLLRFNSSARAVLGIAFDRGGVRAAIADLSLDILAEDSLRLDLPTAPIEDALAAARAVADSAIRASGIRRDLLIGAGVSLPVPLDLAADRIVVPKILPPWAGLRPRRAFEELTGLPVYVDNDANAAALAELRWGAGRGLSDFIYVKLSPGMGAAIVSGGRLYRGAAGFAGELGHIRAGEHGPVCACGNRSCIGPSRRMSHLVELLRPTHGRGLTPRRMLELVAEGDTEAVRVVRDACRVLGRALANLCNVLNPEAILIGGALAAAGETLVAGVREAIDSYALRPIADTVDVRLAELADRGELLGVLTLVPVDAARRVRL